mmetsp:Transcript_14044/g.24630  ORF Transcript_14044/g.24630 Transcript_14044/m.24630 type:complete len:324 (-) Transcript_14044:140-1111(-)|eukprot:CAMPEP_0175072700 /NCGR_PEP_ID=MMETSP0052_2-20121109/20070_1 /TAXON_ID=51329 ORGANISM="Polytomella parva, Strain SAG 63-3" /NCGR_SAMPLE_ID=MMETSP0052_2 /ASSEMBLY_ACC=CAM_ASM_000194 /LENGTH=323 /DNA_ID=CAMNT_0016340263 /DNA_START=61 /DNA_END=1032 /DNA_ORIENTATION=-
MPSYKNNREGAQDGEAEAMKLVKTAKKFIAPSILDMRIKPDWESATPLLEKAASIFKQNGLIDQAIDALERAATGQEKQGSPWHAAKNYEVCADLCKKAKNPDGMVRYFGMAGDSYLEAAKPTTAAEVITRGARALEELDSEASLKLYYDALDIYETNDKESYSPDSFRLLINFLLKLERWEEAVEAQMRFGLVCDKVEARTSQVKAYLGAIVTWLHAGNASQAWQTFQDAMEVDVFANSKEAFAADELFQLYRNQDEEGISAFVRKKGEFKSLDNKIAKIAMQLPSPLGKLKRMARQLEKILGAAEREEEEKEAEQNAEDLF